LAEVPGIRREMGFKETVTKSFSLYRQNFKAYLIVFLLAAGISGLINIGIEKVYPIPMSSPNPSFLEQLTDQIASLPQSILTVVALSPVTSISNSMGISLSADLLEKQHSSLGQSWRLTRERFRQVWLVTILANLLASLGFALFLLPGVLLSIIFFVATPVVLLENKGAVYGLNRSRQLVNKIWGRIFGLVLFTGLIVGIPTLLAGLIVPSQSLLGVLSSSLIEALYLPFFIGLITITYYSTVARMTEQSKRVKQTAGPVQLKLWVCRNCGTSYMYESKPSPIAFGGCSKAKRGFFSYPGKHDWTEAPTTTEATGQA
jgi:hypothetical protein